MWIRDVTEGVAKPPNVNPFADPEDSQELGEPQPAVCKSSGL